MTLFLIIGLTSCCLTILSVAVAVYFICHAKALERELQDTVEHYEAELMRVRKLLFPEGKKEQAESKPHNPIGFALKEAS